MCISRSVEIAALANFRNVFKFHNIIIKRAISIIIQHDRSTVNSWHCFKELIVSNLKNQNRYGNEKVFKSAQKRSKTLNKCFSTTDVQRSQNYCAKRLCIPPAHQTRQCPSDVCPDGTLVFRISSSYLFETAFIEW